MKSLREAVLASALALASAAQASLVLYRQPASPSDSQRFILGATAICIVVALLWIVRGWLNSHADMLLLMGGFGGLGMMLGDIADNAPSCHLGSLQFFSWMNAGMVVGGFIPAISFSRCLISARRAGRLPSVIAADLIGMWLGMAIPGWMISRLEISPSLLGILAHPVSLSSMLAGMTIGMTFSAVWLERRQIAREDDPRLRVSD